MLAEIRPTFARSHRSYIVTEPREQDGNERRISGTRCCSKLCFRRQQPGLKHEDIQSTQSNGDTSGSLRYISFVDRRGRSWLETT
jgi:hypothetical protein